MARRLTLGLTASCVLLTGCASMEAEAPIERRDVSPRVLDLLEEMVPGFEIASIEAEIEDEVLTYEFDGVQNGVELEVEMTPMGDDIEVEIERDGEELDLNSMMM